jgi:hypothetical protein
LIDDGGRLSSTGATESKLGYTDGLGGVIAS